MLVARFAASSHISVAVHLGLGHPTSLSQSKTKKTNMKFTILLNTLLLLLPISLIAADQITIEVKFIESSNAAIPHDITKLIDRSLLLAPFPQLARGVVAGRA